MEQNKGIPADIVSKYKQVSDEEMQALEQEGFTEEELHTESVRSLLSCIFCEREHSVENAIEKMKIRYTEIIDRIIMLENGKYSRFSMARNEIAMGLYIIQRDKLYLASDYKTVFDVAKAVLDFSRMQTTNYIRVAKRFIEPKRPVSVFYVKYGTNEARIDFSISQLIQLLKLSDEEITYCFDNGMLDFTTSVTGIKALVKTMKERKAQEQAEQLQADMEPVTAAYEGFHKAYNSLKERVAEDKESCELLQSIMDSMVVLYVECTKDK